MHRLVSSLQEYHVTSEEKEMVLENHFWIRQKRVAQLLLLILPLWSCNASQRSLWQEISIWYPVILYIRFSSRMMMIQLQNSFCIFFSQEFCYPWVLQQVKWVWAANCRNFWSKLKVYCCCVSLESGIPLSDTHVTVQSHFDVNRLM